LRQEQEDEEVDFVD
jgi:uncharacterized protein YdhG (YjbR/CyaY superfamily)/transposase